MFIKCHKCSSMFELEDEWGNQPDLEFPCPSCSAGMTVSRNRNRDADKGPAPAPARAPSKSVPKSDRTMVMPDADDGLFAPAKPSAPAPAGGFDSTAVGQPAIGGNDGGDATMMMQAPSDDFFNNPAHQAEATEFIDASTAPKSNDDMAFEATGFMPAVSQQQAPAHQEADATAFLDAVPAQAPAHQEADATAFLQAPMEEPNLESTAFIDAAPAPSYSQPGPPKGGMMVDHNVGDATAFLDAPGAPTPGPASDGDSTQMVSAVDEAQLQAWLAKQKSKQHEQKQIAHQQRGINENKGGGTAMITGGMPSNVSNLQGPPADWGPIPQQQAPPQARGGKKKGKKKAKKKKGGAGKFIFILLLLAALGGGGYYVWFYVLN